MISGGTQEIREDLGNEDEEIGDRPSGIREVISKVLGRSLLRPRSPRKKRKGRGDHLHAREKARRSRQAGFEHALKQSQALDAWQEDFRQRKAARQQETAGEDRPNP